MGMGPILPRNVCLFPPHRIRYFTFFGIRRQVVVGCLLNANSTFVDWTSCRFRKGWVGIRQALRSVSGGNVWFECSGRVRVLKMATKAWASPAVVFLDSGLRRNDGGGRGLPYGDVALAMGPGWRCIEMHPRATTSTALAPE